MDQIRNRGAYIEPLTGSNYKNWKCSIDFYLAWANVDHCLTERRPLPHRNVRHTKEFCKKWLESDKVAMSIIRQTLFHALDRSIAERQTSRELMEAIAARFDKDDNSLANMKLLEPLVPLEPLTFLNFKEWKSQIDLILARENVDHCLTVDRPAEPTEETSAANKKLYHKWLMSNRKALFMIEQSMSTEVLQKIPHKHTARELMEVIVARLGNPKYVEYCMQTPSVVPREPLEARFVVPKCMENTIPWECVHVRFNRVEKDNADKVRGIRAYFGDAPVYYPTDSFEIKIRYCQGTLIDSCYHLEMNDVTSFEEKRIRLRFSAFCKRKTYLSKRMGVYLSAMHVPEEAHQSALEKLLKVVLAADVAFPGLAHLDIYDLTETKPGFFDRDAIRIDECDDGELPDDVLRDLMIF